MVEYDIDKALLFCEREREREKAHYGNQVTPDVVWATFLHTSGWTTVSYGMQIPHFITCSYFNLKISMCHKLFITLWWWKSFGLNLGRGGAANQWGMAGMLKGDTIVRRGWVRWGGFCYEVTLLPQTHTHSNNLSEVDKHMSAGLWMLNQEPHVDVIRLRGRGHTGDQSDNPDALIL